MLDLIASILVRGLNLLFHAMPITVNLWLGRRVGRLVYYLSPGRSSIAYANLKAAFHGQKTPGQIKRITKDVYENLAQVLAEMLSMTKMDKRYIERFVTVHNMERVKRASKNPKGMILLSAHFGNWELSTATSVVKGFPLHMLARDQSMKRLNELLNTLRESKGNVVVRKGMDVKNIFRILHSGKGVGMLGDQNAGPMGRFVRFFGRPASTAVGPFRFAQKTGAWILPAFIHRRKGPYHDLYLEEPIIIKKDDDLVGAMQRYNSLLEDHVRRFPGQWLWMHRRWKRTPSKYIMVLNDGKKGHLNQSMAVVKELRRCLEKDGYPGDQAKVETIDVYFKNKTAKALFNMTSVFFASYVQGRTGWLKLTLTKESYAALANRYADIVISCGSNLYGVNKWMKLENGARNLTVLDPGPLNRGGFNLIVLPKHDFSRLRSFFPSKRQGLGLGNNLVVTELAPNLIQGSRLRHSGFGGQAGVPPSPFWLRRTGRGEGRAERGKRLVLGVLFGGENRYFSFGDELTRSLAEGLREASEKLNADIYITTSRRTPAGAERILEEAFMDKPNCLGFVHGKTDESRDTVKKILEASRVIIVSGESISMVSEAVSSGKPVIVFMPDKKKKGRTKYEAFVEDLEKRHRLTLAEVDHIPAVLERVTTRKIKLKSTVDNMQIRKEMYRLF